MRSFSWWNLAALVAASLMLGLAVLGYFQPDLRGRWCPDDSHWLVCYRDWLVPLSGWAAAFAAAAFIAFERHQARDTERNRERAARMLIVSRLEGFCSACDQIVSETSNWIQSDGDLGERRTSLPDFTIPTDIPEVALLPEAEALFAFARNIALINHNATGLFEITSDLHQTTDYVRVRAATSAVRAYAWRNQLARQIGWNDMTLHGDRLAELRAIAKEAVGEDAANLPDTD